MTQEEKQELRKSSEELYAEIDRCLEYLISARINKNVLEEIRVYTRMETLMVGTMQHLRYVIDRLDEIPVEPPASPASDEVSREENVVLPRWMFECIHEGVRMANNYRKSVRVDKGLPETCLDRVLEEAWGFSCDAMREVKRETRNAKIRNRLTPLSNVIAMINELKGCTSVEYRDLVIDSLVKYNDDLRSSMEELKKII